MRLFHRRTSSHGGLSVILLTTIGFYTSILNATSISTSDRYSFSGELRSFFFQRDFKTGTVDREDFAVGGIFRARAQLNQHLLGGLSIYTSQDFGLNDDSKDVYNLIGKDADGNHEGYTVLGEAYLQAFLGNASLSVGRQGLNTPWLNRHDVRMSPHSFSATSFSYQASRETAIHLGYVTRMKYKNETHFVPMSKSAGFGGDEPVTYGGIIHNGFEGWKFQLWDYFAHEMWNDVYLRLDREWTRYGLYGNARYLYRHPVGQRLAGDAGTWHFGVTGGLKKNGLELSMAYSKNDGEAIVRPWGHDTTISNQVYVADRADETAWKLKIGYDFNSDGIKGLTTGVAYAAHDTPNSGSSVSPDRRELNLDLTYEFSRELNGLSLRARHAIVHETGTVDSENLNDSRLYLRYKFDL